MTRLDAPGTDRSEPDVFWPRSTPRPTFAARRRRLQARLDQPAWLTSGLPRPRNFAGNPYPFRAESHFLYFLGVSTPAAVLRIDPDNATLYRFGSVFLLLSPIGTLAPDLGPSQ